MSDRSERIELIKRRQLAARSSTGTKALLIQTFTEDLPWLIEQAERCEEMEAKLQADGVTAFSFGGEFICKKCYLHPQPDRRNEPPF